KMWSFFFFQAEDGIRDFHVPGVQTCALPISLAAREIVLPGMLQADPGSGVPQCRHGLLQARPVLFDIAQLARTQPFAELFGAVRSEERRVGKEGRARWAAVW